MLQNRVVAADGERLLQVSKQAELRELRKLDERSTPSFGRRASRPLEAKWRLTIPRSPLCEGCGVRTVAAAEGSSGSKAWKCGPCVRAIEEVSYSSRTHRSIHSFQSLLTDADFFHNLRSLGIYTRARKAGTKSSTAARGKSRDWCHKQQGWSRFSLRIAVNLDLFEGPSSLYFIRTYVLCAYYRLQPVLKGTVKDHLYSKQDEVAGVRFCNRTLSCQCYCTYTLSCF
jgi:hypothetical protein